MITTCMSCVLLIFRNVEVDENPLDAEAEVYKHAETLLRDLLSRIDEMSKSVRDLVVKINLNSNHRALGVSFHTYDLFENNVKDHFILNYILLAK